MEKNSGEFNPYHKWLGLPKNITRPNHYQLLGIPLFEADEEVITSAADSRMMYLRTFQSGKYSQLSQKLLNEVSAARICLLTPEEKASYDRKLRIQATTVQPTAVQPTSSQITPVSVSPTPVSVSPTPVSVSPTPILVSPTPVSVEPQPFSGSKPLPQGSLAPPKVPISTQTPMSKPMPAPTFPQTVASESLFDSSANSSTYSSRPRQVPRKKEKSKAVFILLGLLILGGIAAFLYFEGNRSPQKVADFPTRKKSVKTKQAEEPLPEAAQIPPPVERSAGDRMTKTIQGVEYAFRWCPPGTFHMGSPATDALRYDNEPYRKVTLTRGFWMLETEVTQKMWKSIMGNNPSMEQGDELPVEQVTWGACNQFCQKLGQLAEMSIRLPTEAEWEYACRAGTTTRYYYGDNVAEMTKYGNFCDGVCELEQRDGRFLDGFARTSPVRHFAPNPWGLYDMHGNVWEWCSDWFSFPTEDDVTDPTGPSSGTERVDRGGSWFDPPEKGCRSARRGQFDPNHPANSLGFRIVGE